jgi:hypothetical protein
VGRELSLALTISSLLVATLPLQAQQLSGADHQRKVPISGGIAQNSICPCRNQCLSSYNLCNNSCNRIGQSTVDTCTKACYDHFTSCLHGCPTTGPNC